MAAGLVLGRLVPGTKAAFQALQIDTVSLPIALGLLWMMYPVLAKVKYEELPKAFKEWKVFSLTLALNWAVAPLVMFGLAWLFMANQEGFRNGLILVGIAPCIAMVLIWNALAGGDAEKCAILVALNSLFQVFCYSLYAYLLIGSAGVTMWDVGRSVLIFLGIPLLAGFLTRVIGCRLRGKQWYDEVLMAKLGPTALVGLLFTITMMFAMQGDKILGNPAQIAWIALPLLCYFMIMFSLGFVASWLLGFRYADTATVSFVGSGNNFELAIAVAIATFGINSDAALATVVGPLIEVPVLVLFVYVALALRTRMFVGESGESTYRREVVRDGSGGGK